LLFERRAGVRHHLRHDGVLAAILTRHEEPTPPIDDIEHALATLFTSYVDVWSG
jgi:hypothetical protein